ncbi:MAG TPA: hypothetical protein VN731_02650 [Rhodanobacter sp.]|nr:hypothetical protein [Rhodanobacter sp.]
MQITPVADAIVCPGLSAASRASCMLSALWAYIHGDYFGLYMPGKLQGMLAAGDRWGR